MKLFATFLKNECNFLNFLEQQKLSRLIRYGVEWQKYGVE